MTVCSNEGCFNEAYIRMLKFKLDGTPNLHADKLYCKSCWSMGSFDYASNMPTRWPEGAEL